jgi:hypothetical protein
MKKKPSNDETGQSQDDEMLPEYDLEDKPHVRGKYYEAYQGGHEVRIKEADGSTTVQYFTLEEGAVLLDPQVKAYFPDSESVNRALRSLIDLIPRERKRRVAGAKENRRKLDL